MAKISMGVDLSLSGTGIVVTQLDDCGDLVRKTLHHSVIKTKPKDDLSERCSIIVSDVIDVYNLYKPNALIVEDVVVSKFGGAVIPMVSLAAIFRYFMRQWQMDYYLVPPNTLKKFVTGNGSAPKDMMMMKVATKYGFEAKDNNEADAYGLAMIGHALINPHFADSKYEQEALIKVTYHRHT